MNPLQVGKQTIRIATKICLKPNGGYFFWTLLCAYSFFKRHQLQVAMVTHLFYALSINQCAWLSVSVEGTSMTHEDRNPPDMRMGQKKGKRFCSFLLAVVNLSLNKGTGNLLPVGWWLNNRHFAYFTSKSKHAFDEVTKSHCYQLTHYLTVYLSPCG